MQNEAQQARDAAIQQVEAATPIGWSDAARQLVLRVAAQLGAFTTDDVWAAGLTAPPEPRALGAVMTSLARERLITATSQFLNTKRRSRHAAPVRVWRFGAP